MARHSSTKPDVPTAKPLLGIGACLAGQAVRYNGESHPAAQTVESVTRHFRLHQFCPELDIGLGVPRPPIHLVGEPDLIQALDVATHQHDYALSLAQCASQVLRQAPDLCAYLLVAASPSCGHSGVKRHASDGRLLARDATGVFAAALQRADPLLPLEDNRRLEDPGRQESFVARAFAYHSWKELRQRELCLEDMTAFYHYFKWHLMAHHIQALRPLARLLANHHQQLLETLADQFIGGFMQALRQRATRRSHSYVLLRLAQTLEPHLQSDKWRHLSASIAQYRLGTVALTEPIELLRRHWGGNSNAYLELPH